MATSLWQIDGSVASLVGTGVTLRLDRPADGIAGLVDGARVLAIRPAASESGPSELSLEDAYSRGVDLVARYQASDSFPFRTEIYWRVGGSESQPSVTLIISVETDLLDTHPALLVASRIPTGHLERYRIESPGALVASAAGEAVDSVIVGREGRAWLEAVHPSDRGEAEFSGRPLDDDGVSLEWRLFSRFLEKGVIRRARLLGAPLSGGEPLALAAAQLEALAAQAPPLTV